MYFHTWTYARLFAFFLLFTRSGLTEVSGPTHITASVGEDVCFKWSAPNNTILSVNWGIRKGNTPNPQFINVNNYTGKVNFNDDMDPRYVGRVNFIGNLRAGKIWFILKKITLNDTNEYIASISDYTSSVLPYIVHLKVEEKKVTTTKRPFSIERDTTNSTNVYSDFKLKEINGTKSKGSIMYCTPLALRALIPTIVYCLSLLVSN